MTTVEAIRKTKTFEEAILVIAQAVDDLKASLNTSTPRWGDGATGNGPAWGSAPGMTTGDSQPQYEAVEVPVDYEAVSRLERAYAEANEAFEMGRRAGLGKPELVALSQRAEGIRGRLDLARNPGAVVMTTGDMVGDPEKVVMVYEDPTQVLYDLPDASDEIKAQRRAMAEAVDLAGSFPIVMRQTEEAKQEIVDNYVKGGPLWLYYGDEFGRDIIMQQPKPMRDAMVHDVYETTGDVRFTHEFARDVMKEGAGQDDEDNDHLEEYKQHTWQMSDHGGAPLGGAIPAPSMDHS